MLTESTETALPEPDDQPRLLAVEIGDWPGLGGTVRLDLSPQRTVLVGKNGAGKSLFLEGIFQAINRIVSPVSVQPAPRYFRCDVERPGAPPIAYEYHIAPDDMAEHPDIRMGGPPPRRLPAWTERCWELPDKGELWHIENSTLILKDHDPMPFLPGIGLLSAEAPAGSIPSEAVQIFQLLFGFWFIRAGVPRSEDSQRREILLHRQGGHPGWRSAGRARLESLAQVLMSTWEYRRESYDEFVEIIRRLDLVQDVTIKVYEDPHATPTDATRQDFASVLFDGLNIGLQSDGTLRVAEIILNLIRPEGSGLLIEEPETAVHPGLLSRLLALMDSYGFDRQLIISTHSPAVVNWCKPEQLRLVDRAGKETQIHPLADEDIRKVTHYLQDEGTFGDFIFERAST